MAAELLPVNFCIAKKMVPAETKKLGPGTVCQMHDHWVGVDLLVAPSAGWFLVHNNCSQAAPMPHSRKGRNIHTADRSDM